MTFGEGRFVKVRKPHRCEWCFEPIPIGSLAFHFHGQWEGDWQNWYMHPECEGVYARNEYDDGFTPGEGKRPEYADHAG